MSWFSILPANLQFLETWAIRTFLLLGILTIGPWIIFLVYDLSLFLIRITTYNLPYVGGRARNRPRPRAPSLRSRPGGRPRALSFQLPGVTITSPPNSPKLTKPPTPTRSATETGSTGFEERDWNGNGAVQRSGKGADVLSREVAAKLRALYEQHSWEALEQVDMTGIAKETGLTTSQVRTWFSNHHQKGEAVKTPNP